MAFSLVSRGQRTLAATNYLYTEYADDELYKKCLEEILQLLPKYRVVELWPENVLLENLSWKNEIDT